jgi:hypothetical protein
MSKTKTYDVCLVSRSILTGKVEATSVKKAIEEAERLWYSDPPHPFERAGDDDLIRIAAKAVRP